jgi:DNA-binding HxlR family transcriptional regulator
MQGTTDRPEPSEAVVDGEDGVRVEHGISTETISDLQAILSETKIRLLQQILASDTAALGAVELAARNDITESTIRDHLRELAGRDEQIVCTLEAETDEPVPNGIPRQYYAVTEYGIDLLKQIDMYEQIGLLYDMYNAADLTLPDTERPVSIDEIEEYKHRPSPDWL